MLLALRNDPVVRAQSFTTAEMDRRGHEAWLRRKLTDERTRLYIVESGGAPVGQVRVDALPPGHGEISVALDAAHRGKGIGRRVIALASARAASELGLESIVARIREENDASRRAFEAAGYTRTESVDGVVSLLWAANSHR